MRLLALLVLATVLLSCGAQRVTQMRGSGVNVREVSARERATIAGGVVLAPGDFVLEGGNLRAIVGGLSRPPEARGAILEVSLDGAPPDDSIVLFAPRLFLASSSYPVITTEAELVTRDGRPTLRLVGEVRAQGRVIEVTRELTISAGSQSLSTATRVHADDGEEIASARVGGRIAWGGASPFIPGVGELSGTAWHEASWIGRRGVFGAAVFGFHGGPVRAQGSYERHGATEFLSHTDVAGPMRTIAADDSLYERSALSLAQGGISDALRRLGWARAAHYPEILVELPYVPEGARVIISTADNAPLVSVQPRGRGRVVVPLVPEAPAPHGYLAVGTAYGHAPSDEVRFDADTRLVRVAIPEGGRVRVRVRDGTSGVAIPARVRFIGVGSTRTAPLGPDSRADGAGDAVITVEGEVIVPIQTGTYRVVVTRGPEWSLSEEIVTVTPTFRPDVLATLQHVVDPGPWIASDLHLHAAPSPDSEVSLRDRVRSLVAEGIRFAVPTDHNHVTDYSELVEGMALNDFITVPGVEVTTWEPNFGHFNAYPYPLDPRAPGNGAPAYSGLTPDGLFSSLHAVDPDVVVQVNHPRLEGLIGYFDVVGLDPATGTAGDSFSPSFDVLEVWNGFDLARPAVFERVFSEWLLLLARGARYVASGNSDSHKIRYQWAGYPRTYIRAPDGFNGDPRALTRALREGHAFVTSGPFLEAEIGGRGPGDTVVHGGGPLELAVRVRAPRWMDVGRVDIYGGSDLLMSVPVTVRAPDAVDPSLRFSERITFDPEGVPFVVVVARGEAPMDVLFDRSGIPPIAFSNPIWLEQAAGGEAAPDAGEDASDGAIPEAGTSPEAPRPTELPPTEPTMEPTPTPPVDEPTPSEQAPPP